MPDPERQAQSTSVGPHGCDSRTPSVSLVVPYRRTGESAAELLAECCRQLRRRVPGCRILAVPLDVAATADLSSVGVQSTGAFDQLLPTCRTVWDAVVIAAESADTSWIGVLSELSAFHSAAKRQLAESTSENCVIVLESHIPEAGWFDRLLSGVEWAASALLYGPLPAIPRGAVVLASRELWQAIHSPSQTPLTRPECVASFADRGAVVVRIANVHIETMAIAPPAGLRERVRDLAAILRGWWTRRQFAPSSQHAVASTDWSWARLATLLGLAAAMFFTNLNTPLLEPDEGRHAEIAREMWVTGDWLAPQFQYEPYLDKPPLLYWLSCASFAVFGVHDWSTRLVTAGCGLLTVLGVYGIGRRLVGERPAWMGAVILVLSLGFATCARFLILESVLTMCVVTALLLGVQADLHGRWSWRWWLSSAVACGLGLLTKGPVAAVLIVPPLVVHHWLTSSPGPSFWRRWIPFGLIAVGLAAPWFIAVVITRPQFVRYFFWQHNLNRFLSGTNHEHSLLFYVPVVLIGFIPWTLLLFPSVGFVCSRDSAKRELRTPALGFLALWAGWCLAFFSAAAGKLPYYILSCLPALALLMGYYLDRVVHFWSTDAVQRLVAMRRIRRGSWIVTLTGLGIAPVILLLGVTSTGSAIALTLFWCGLLVALWRLPVNRSPAWSWGLFCLIAFTGVAQLTQTGLGGWQERYAVLPKSTTTLATLHDPHTQVICVGATWGSVPFYLQRDDVVCVEVSELPTLTDVIDPTRRALLLVEHKLPLDSVVPLLPDGTSWTQHDGAPRVAYLELAPNSGSSTSADVEPVQRTALH